MGTCLFGKKIHTKCFGFTWKIEFTRIFSLGALDPPKFHPDLSRRSCRKRTSSASRQSAGKASGLELARVTLKCNLSTQLWDVSKSPWTSVAVTLSTFQPSGRAASRRWHFESTEDTLLTRRSVWEHPTRTTPDEKFSWQSRCFASRLKWKFWVWSGVSDVLTHFKVSEVTSTTKLDQNKQFQEHDN